jgi:hypothetical protein
MSCHVTALGVSGQVSEAWAFLIDCTCPQKINSHQGFKYSNGILFILIKVVTQN